MLIWLSLAPAMRKIKDLPKWKKAQFLLRLKMLLALLFKIMSDRQKTVSGSVTWAILWASAKWDIKIQMHCLPSDETGLYNIELKGTHRLLFVFLTVRTVAHGWVWIVLSLSLISNTHWGKACDSVERRAAPTGRVLCHLMHTENTGCIIWK